MPARDLGGQGADLVEARQVGQDEVNAVISGGLGDLAHGSLAALLVAAMHEHRGTLIRKALGEGAAEPVGRPSDENRLLG